MKPSRLFYGFALAAILAASPALAGWSEVLYVDTSCSGRYATGDPQIVAPLPVTAGAVVCVLVREYAPATAPAGARNVVAVSATLAYGGSAAPPASTLTLTDTTTVTTGGALVLTKQVANLTQGTGYGTSDAALPGQVLQYQITLANQGAQAATTVAIDDTTPAYTTYVSAACPNAASLPPGLTSCTVTVQPAPGGTGPLQWSFGGALAPGSQTTVSYQVQVAP